MKLSYLLTQKHKMSTFIANYQYVKYQSSFKNDQVFQVRVFRVQVLVIFEKFDTQIIRVFSNISSLSNILSFSNCYRVLADAKLP